MKYRPSPGAGALISILGLTVSGICLIPPVKPIEIGLSLLYGLTLAILILWVDSLMQEPKKRPKMDKNKTIPTLSQATVSGSLSFKEKMKQDIIPRVWQMAEKEKDHLNWLIDNNAPKDMIETSRRYLNNFRQRHKEYIENADGL